MFVPLLIKILYIIGLTEQNAGALQLYVAWNEGCLCVLVGRFNGILPSKLFQNIH